MADKDKKVKEELIKRATKKNLEKEKSIKSIVTSSDNSSDEIDFTPSFEPGVIAPRSISVEMKSNYIDYSMSVIVSRALPEVKDGLKPSQRRILVAMNDLGLNSTAHYRKCAKIAGDTSGNYHPHGETVVYPTLATE
jgi:DNA gyrase subunit A